ncbi:exodeoxyribonuclease-like [Bolinopsis microptera]|uniref:exodeoxyribonuclease-like n=1 Tax=Bolinopsis microptera TaxID=2820187 RepID=UPI003078B676
MAPKRSNSANSTTSASKKLKLSAPGSLDHMTLPSELEGKIDFKPVCTTKEGLPWNLKIVSWNVNGIRAVVKSNKLDYLKFEDADIVCFQETKCFEADFPEAAKFQGYHRFYNSAAKKGYSSTAVLSKVKPVSVTYGIDIPEHDNEGRVITAEYANFYLVNVYVPNSGQKTVRLPYRRKWNVDFLAYCQDLDAKKPVVVAGDLNVAHTEIDLANPKTNTKNSGFTPEERGDFTTLLDGGFIDTFRHFYPDKIGAYSFWTYMSNSRKRNVGWRIDYFLVSTRFMGRIAASEIRELVLGSDHCPIMLLCADLGREVKDEVKSEVKDEVTSEVTSEVKGEVTSEVKDEVTSEVKNDTTKGVAKLEDGSNQDKDEKNGAEEEHVKLSEDIENVENLEPKVEGVDGNDKDMEVVGNGGIQNTNGVEA